MHPGGLNVAFADGSVRFIKDSISSWPNIAANSYAAPTSYYTLDVTCYFSTPLTISETLSSPRPRSSACGRHSPHEPGAR